MISEEARPAAIKKRALNIGRDLSRLARSYVDLEVCGSGSDNCAGGDIKGLQGSLDDENDFSTQ